MITTYSNKCEDCSKNFEVIETAEVGLCGGVNGSIVKSWNITDVTESSFNEKFRILELTGGHFGSGSSTQSNPNEVKVTDYILTNKFEFTLIKGTITEIKYLTGKNFRVGFNSFHDGMQLIITLKNATLEELYYSPTSSTPIKLLLPNTVKIPIANSAGYSPEIINMVEITGKAIG